VDVGSPETNVDQFRHRPSQEIAALLPDREAVDSVLAEFQAGGVDISAVQILDGAEGARILDPTGVEHGLRARVVRFLQNLGYDESILAVYYEGLSKGECLLTVPCPAVDRYRLGQVLVARGAHGVIYFGAGAAETLTAP
jgi:hypothetical protein